MGGTATGQIFCACVASTPQFCLGSKLLFVRGWSPPEMAAGPLTPKRDMAQRFSRTSIGQARSGLTRMAHGMVRALPARAPRSANPGAVPLSCPQGSGPYSAARGLLAGATFWDRCGQTSHARMECSAHRSQPRERSGHLLRVGVPAGIGCVRIALRSSGRGRKGTKKQAAGRAKGGS